MSAGFALAIDSPLIGFRSFKGFLGPQCVTYTFGKTAKTLYVARERNLQF